MLMERGRNTIARAGILEQEEGVCSPLTEQLQSWPTFQAVRQLIDANPALELHREREYRRREQLGRRFGCSGGQQMAQRVASERLLEPASFGRDGELPTPKVMARSSSSTISARRHSAARCSMGPPYYCRLVILQRLALYLQI